jgi:hypothetical protein
MKIGYSTHMNFGLSCISIFGSTDKKQKKNEKFDAHIGFLARGRKSKEKKHGRRQEVG